VFGRHGKLGIVAQRPGDSANRDGGHVPIKCEDGHRRPEISIVSRNFCSPNGSPDLIASRIGWSEHTRG
jgi:hypothetical protein